MLLGKRMHNNLFGKGFWMDLGTGIIKNLFEKPHEVGSLAQAARADL